MARRPSSIPLPAALRHRRDRLLANRAVRAELVSVAGLVGRPARNPANEHLGSIADVVVRWHGERYPPVTGLVVKVGRRTSFVAIEQISELRSTGVRLRSGRVDLIGYHHREDEVALCADVMDHQLVDVDGVRVVRAADLYLARQQSRLLLVGVDVGFQSLLRRLGPARFRSRATPDRVIDWAAIQPFAAGDARVPLQQANQELHRLRPAELADLLEQLGRAQRQELLETLTPDVAADALEEMEREPLVALLGEAPTEQAAALVASMEPDEAADALRDLPSDRRRELLEEMRPEQSAALAPLLLHEPRTAGGIMTTRLVTAHLEDTVADAREALREAGDHDGDIDNVSVLDDDGRLVDEISLYDIAVSNDSASLRALLAPRSPITIPVDADLDELVHRLVDNRRSSVIVVDDAGRPVGRVLADDVIDALVPERGRVRFPRVVE